LDDEPTWTSNRARIAGLRSKGHAADSPEVLEAKRDLVADRLAAHVRRVVDTAPPLTSAQRDRIAGLLRPTVTTGAGAA
jgi:hypothetical protein